MTQPLILQSTLRVRIGAHDAHYAGSLVDGAKILQFFGDVATELLIRYDGDEGLFRAYESVEFLAPVVAGDYLEITGRLVKVGKTSRTMEFEARKVIQLIPTHSTPHLSKEAVSAAEVLKEPILVCKARGTCVTPLALQRLQGTHRGTP